MTKSRIYNDKAENIYKMRGDIKQKRNLPFSKFLFVGIPGFEPGKAGPESAVLPLHHIPMFIRLCISELRCKDTAFYLITKTFPLFFIF